MVRENITSKKSHGTKHPGNLEHYEKTKSKNNRGRKRKPCQRYRKYFQQNHNKKKKKFPNLKKEMSLKVQEADRQNTKHLYTRKESPFGT